MNEDDLLKRLVIHPRIFGGKPIVRGQRLAVEHVLAMLAAGDDPVTIMEGFPRLERADLLACLLYARNRVASEPMELDRIG